MFPRYYYYLCCVRVNKFRVQNRVRLILSLFSKACKLHGKSIVITVKLHYFYIIKAMEFAQKMYRFVELVGFEPTSKQGNTVLSTRLFRPSFVRL